MTTLLPVWRVRIHPLPVHGGEWATWWGNEDHPRIHGPLRLITAPVLWLFVMGIIGFLAEFCR